ncbi:ATP-binding protein, partial [Streptomyces sp. NPDC060085]|uniref:ATP-binding protein n=1 Tax=Streptomyces sp. NPDC060085 TaxID=3347054 RepID=UPI003661EEDA
MADGVRDLLERESESEVIAAALKDATQGSGGLLVVEGPAGIGKTRLLAELRSQAAGLGLGVARARGMELERDFTYGVVRQLFEPLLATADADVLETLWQAPAVQAQEVFAAADAAVAGPVGDFAVLHGLFWLTANACQDRPLLMVIDDLQWCDVPSLRYLAYLLPRIQDLGLLVAAAVRTGEPATDERLLTQITADANIATLRPGPLSARAADRLLRQALPGEPDEAFTQACHLASGGNPLLLRELARTLAARGLAATAANAPEVAEVGPQSVARLVETRLARLPQTSAVLCQALAVLGGRAELSTAAALAAQDVTTALERATALEHLEILRIRQDAQAGWHLSFIHPLVRTAVYDTIDPAQRAILHRRAAQFLTDAHTDPERIAAHLLYTLPAGDHDTYLTLWTAATAATRRGSPESVYTYLRRALQEPP